MKWNRRYAIKSYLLSTVWTAPVVALVLEQITFRIAYVYQLDFGWIPGFVFDREGAIAAADYVIASSIAVHRLYFQLAARGDSGRERPVDPADHRDHAAARQGHPYAQSPCSSTPCCLPSP